MPTTTAIAPRTTNTANTRPDVYREPSADALANAENVLTVSEEVPHVWAAWEAVGKNNGISWQEFRAAQTHISDFHKLRRGDKIIVPKPKAKGTGRDTFGTGSGRGGRVYDPTLGGPKQTGPMFLNPATGQLMPIGGVSGSLGATALANQLKKGPKLSRTKNTPEAAPASTPASTGTGRSQVDVLKDVESLRHAIETRNGTDETMLIKRLSNRTNAELAEIKKEYKEVVGRDLEKDVAGEGSFNFGRVITQLAKGERNEAPLKRTEAMAEASRIHNMLEGVGTRDKKLIDKFTGYGKAQMSQIAAEYKGLYGQDLAARIKDDTSGDYRTALLEQINGTPAAAAPGDTPAEIRTMQDVVKLNAAIETRRGTDEKALVDVLAHRNNAEMDAIRATYKETYGRSLGGDVFDDTSANFYSTTYRMATGTREEGPMSEAKALAYAREIKDAVDGAGTTDMEVIRIMTGQSKARLQHIARVYQDVYDSSMAKDLMGDTSGWYKYALVSNMANRPMPGLN